MAVLSRESTQPDFSFGFPSDQLNIESEGDILHVMQRTVTHSDTSDSVHSQFDLSDHSDSLAHIPQDWMLDLQRVVARHTEECTADRDDEFLFSIYTWYLDHETSKLCNTPKIAILGGDPTEWEDDIIYPWRHRLRDGERTQLRLVQPNTPRANVEEHIAHILVIQRETDDSSVLLSMEFLSEHEHNVIVRTATVVPRSCTALDISALVPIFDRFFPSRMTWEHPISNPEDDRHLSLCIRVRVAQETHFDAENDQEAVRDDQVSLFQIDSEVLLPKCRFKVHTMIEEPRDSFTEEFLQAVQAVQQAQEIEPPPIDPLAIEAQPRAFQELWTRFHLQTALNSTNLPETVRIESWYLNHVTYHKCHSSRLTLLNIDFLRWREQIANTWSDKVINPNALIFDLVEPMPEDSATGIIAQLVLTEADMPLRKSAVLSVYDSEEDSERNPYTFALVLQSRISLSRLLDTLHLQLDCPPVNIRNLCSLWFGSIPIGSSHEVSVQAGNAYRLVLSRGVYLDVPHLLTLDNAQLRGVLQRAIHLEIYDRPPDPSFVFPIEATELTFDIPIDSRPPWIPILERHFQTRQENFDVNEPPALAVMTWYLNQDVNYHGSAPCLVRITDESFMWRTDCIFPWRNRLIRAVPADLVALHQLVAASADGSPRPHVIVTQGVSPENFAVLVTVQGTDGLQLPHRQFAHLFPGRVSGRDILRLAVHADHAHRPVIIQLDGQTYFSDDTIVLQSGSSLLVLVSGANIDIYSEQIADGFSMMQQQVTCSWAPKVCKPANFERPDDFPVSIVSNRVQRPMRPYHDGETSWISELGRLFPLFGEYNAWEEETSIFVTSWYIHHTRRPVCHRHKLIRLVNNPLSWIEDIRITWQDLLDRSRPFTIRIVRPRPPQFREHHSPCHIIVEQAPQDGKVVAVLTALIEGTPNDAIIQSAHSLDHRLNTATIIRTMDITRFCSGRACTLFQDRQAVPGLDWIEVQSGSSLYLRIRNVLPESETFDIDNETHQHFADLSLMQTSTFVFNPNATEFTPGQPLINTQPEHLQDLRVCWNSGAFAWEEESRALHILTWFVAPGRGILRCLYGRRVTLYEDFRQWEVAMKTKWNDLIDPQAPVSFVVVSPSPPHLEHSIGAHVLLIQNEIPSLSSPLVTIYDTAINYGSPFRVVITVDETSTANTIITALEYDDDCQTAGTTCAIWFERLRIQPGRQIAVRDGNCITLQVNRIVLPANWRPPILPKPIGAEGFSLLQTRIDIHKSEEKTVIDLEAALFTDTLVPVNLIHVGDSIIPQTFPTHVLVEDGFSDFEVEQAIAEFRLSYYAHVLHATGFAFVTPVDWKCDGEAWHLVYYPLQFQDRSEIILHRSVSEPTEHDHMVFLHSIYWPHTCCSPSNSTTTTGADFD